MASALPVVLWLDSPLDLVVSSFSGAVFGSGLPGCVSLFPALAFWRFFPLGTPYYLKCAKNNVSMKQWKLISQWWNHETSKNIKLQTRFSTCWKQKICHHFVLVVIVRDSQAAIPSFRMGHMFRLVCTDQLWGGGFIKLGPVNNAALFGPCWHLQYCGFVLQTAPFFQA